jgi:ABC-type glutathione transport system ATPase component
MTALLEVADVTRSYRRGSLLTGSHFNAVDAVSFALPAETPEVFTIIGESGSGKTTLSRMILGLVAPSSGAIRFRGEDIAAIRSRRARLAFMSHVQPVFQNPFEAFNPLKRVERYLFATASAFPGEGSVEFRVDRALHQVGLSLAEIRRRYPHELSGGQLQRIAIARALIPGPALLVADEPVSMVDASLRMSIVSLFRALRDEMRVSIIYITHDLATAYTISDRLIIMRQGRVVESGPARAVLDNPRDEYSILLKNSILSADFAQPEEMTPNA